MKLITWFLNNELLTCVKLNLEKEMNHGLACSIELEFAPGKLQDHKEFLNVTMKNK